VPIIAAPLVRFPASTIETHRCFPFSTHATASRQEDSRVLWSDEPAQSVPSAALARTLRDMLLEQAQFVHEAEGDGPI
jgi:hypothetical protein